MIDNGYGTLVPGYNYVANFVTGDGASTVGWQLPTLNNFNPDGSNCIQIPGRKFSYSTEMIPPAGNEVIVTGVGQYASQFATATRKFQATAHNWPSADFGQNTVSDGHPAPDPSHPDWTDGLPRLLYYSDPALVAQQACNFVCRRIYDMSCHSHRFAIIEAPIGLIAPYQDPNQIRYRPLAFGDPVLLNGYPMFIWSAPSGKWWEGKGQQQQASYELRSVPALAQDWTASGVDEQWRALGAKVT
jgi:hypothetical protein